MTMVVTVPNGVVQTLPSPSEDAMACQHLFSRPGGGHQLDSGTQLLTGKLEPAHTGLLHTAGFMLAPVPKWRKGLSESNKAKKDKCVGPVEQCCTGKTIRVREPHDYCNYRKRHRSRGYDRRGHWHISNYLMLRHRVDVPFSFLFLCSCYNQRGACLASQVWKAHHSPGESKIVQLPRRHVETLERRSVSSAQMQAKVGRGTRQRGEVNTQTVTLRKHLRVTDVCCGRWKWMLTAHEGK